MRSHRKAVLRLKTVGLAIVDKRFAAARQLFEWREDLIRDLGGLESLSAAKLALVEDAARTKLMLDHLDSFIMAQESLVPRSATRAKQRLFPLVSIDCASPRISSRCCPSLAWNGGRSRSTARSWKRSRPTPPSSRRPMRSVLRFLGSLRWLDGRRRVERRRAQP
jgi:hypothetical protein